MSREFWIEYDQGWNHKDVEVHNVDPHIKTSASHKCYHVVDARWKDIAEKLASSISYVGFETRRNDLQFQALDEFNKLKAEKL